MAQVYFANLAKITTDIVGLIFIYLYRCWNENQSKKEKKRSKINFSKLINIDDCDVKVVHNFVYLGQKMSSVSIETEINSCIIKESGTVTHFSPIVQE